MRHCACYWLACCNILIIASMLPDDVYMVTEVIFSSPPRPFVPPMSLPGVLLPPEPSAAPPVSPGVLATPDVPPPVDQVHLAPTFTPKDRSRPRLEDSPGLAPLGPPASNQGADSGGTGPVAPPRPAVPPTRLPGAPLLPAPSEAPLATPKVPAPLAVPPPPAPVILAPAQAPPARSRLRQERPGFASLGSRASTRGTPST